MGWPMLSNAKAPMAYPKRPPATEATTATKAMRNAWLRAAKIIGMSMISGGIGKKELSMKAKSDKAQSARGCSASDKVQV